MSTKIIWTVVVIAVVIVAGAFFALRSDIFIPTSDVPDFDTDVNVRDRDETTAEPDPTKTTSQHIVVVHSFSGDVHTYVGTVTVPTPCHSLNVTAQVAESFPEQVTLQLATVAPESDVVCVQVLDQITFEISVSASEDAQLTRVTFNDDNLSFEIFEEAKG